MYHNDNELQVTQTTNKSATLSATGLAKSYRKRQVVHDVSLSVSTGEVVGLLGPNGAGKTTSFYMMVGLVPADKGRILLQDHQDSQQEYPKEPAKHDRSTNITGLPMHMRAKLGIGYLPQEASVFRKMSVEDNIYAVLELRNELTKNDREEIVEGLLEELSIDHIRTNIGMALSGGERRRVEIARALAANPKFILLDEPFAGVDPISVLDIQETIRHLKARNIGILITDHNVRETLGICDRAYIMNAGAVVAEGEPEAVLNNQTVKEVYLGENFRL